MKEGTRSICDDCSSSGGDGNMSDDQADDDDHSSLPELGDLVPLSVDTDYTEDNVYRSRPHYTKMILIERCVLCRNRRYLLTFLFITLCIIGSVLLLVLSKRFHQSLPNLLHIGKHSTNQIEPVCLSSHLSEGNRTTVEKMNLNRVATAFYNKLIGDNNILASGFLWNDDDAQTSKWRPQGVTTLHTENGFRFALISWYGRADEGYAGRGGRVSFVNVTDMPIDEFLTDTSEIPFYNYRHVLLVDESFCTLPNIHVGGIEYQNGTLYVADSRKGQQAIIEFDMANDLYSVPSSMESLLGYRYVLRASSSFHTPIKPSFFSYDIDNHRFIVGTYAKCGNDAIHSHQDSSDCFNQPKNNLLWFDKNDVSLSSPLPCKHYFPEMQGAVSLNWEDTTVVWTSSSYGAVSNSHLHTFRATPFGKGCPNIDLEEATKVNTNLFPPGLEDLHIEEATRSKARFMWMQTEFGVRQVFAVPIGQLL
mmetsp:Transcript_8700/g.14289  ORF Transcript_8700/g.14289 Transcript_8700/m.14289 type:complete len:477 (+) Transcript_8700:37-1467(+)